MKLIKINYNGQDTWAELSGGECRVLSSAPYDAITYSGETIEFDESSLSAPCNHGKIVCVGKNYRDHALEMGGQVPGEPIIFLKPASSLNHHLGKIIYPRISKRVDYEGELALVIGKTAKNIKPEDAAEYILGYTCLNDVTARDIQASDGQWTRAKGFDTFAPIGPVLCTDIDPSGLGIETKLNGKTVQSSNTSMFMWDIPHVLAFITSCMTLMPGDVVSTGTPAGIGAMNNGDVVEVIIEKIGILKNIVTED